ncbi:DNA polymerase [Noviherbaspirillum humi]|uniref:Type-4 uracil-DNA glycosylase n=1 Tax=Noviherbaspirillum humi TaxID=1688639 RepID=A0A239L0M3_9BURK|nr:UdgX family uracil-DNA binding protein [Noviherbaspirillum humi]SNT23403.1 DNA polymerase [Noviherbaspirillum humi]
MSLSACAGNFNDWRQAARGLLRRGIPPHEVQWSDGPQANDLFAISSNPQAPEAQASMPAAQVPRKLLELLEEAACFRTPERWALLYRVLWRWTSGETEVLSAADEDGARLHAWAKAVHREAHKMEAFLRFRERAPELGAPRFVAWFEPEHDVLARVARHFAHRMGRSTWLIATPRGIACWDGERLEVDPEAAGTPPDGEDRAEALWLTYYRSTFNPARLNTSAMEMHMPVRYWKNLPESKLIPDLVSQAGSGARKVAQARGVGARQGATIDIQPEAAQPEREAPTSLDQCRRCELWRNATQGVPGEGPASARIMLVGEQPGDQEDLQGHPFVGPAGKLLDSAMSKAGLDRNTVYLTNAVKHFKWEPRGKRRLHKTPAQKEVDACSYWLEQEVAQVGPEVIVVLGSTALKSVLHTGKAGLTELIGKPFEHEGRWIVATYHPSYVLRVPDEEAKARAFEALVEAFQIAQEKARRH